jgi:hypothetical protein
MPAEAGKAGGAMSSGPEDRSNQFGSDRLATGTADGNCDLLMGGITRKRLADESESFTRVFHDADRHGQLERPFGNHGDSPAVNRAASLFVSVTIFVDNRDKQVSMTNAAPVATATARGYVTAMQ